MRYFLMLIIMIGEISSLLPNKKEPTNNTLIENKSWLERQNASRNDGDNNGGDVVVFEGGTWKAQAACTNCANLQRYQTACRSKGEYLNLCGECVGGSSEKDDDYGVDSCNICSGLDSCGRTSCSDSPDDEFESDTNCTHEVTIRQKVIDIASSLIGQVNLVGNVEGEIFRCSIFKEAQKLGDGKMVEMELGTAIEFELPDKEGRMELRCNSSEDISFTHSMLVVDSRKLHPLSADVKSIEFGIESTVELTVGNMHALADLLCFARDESGNIVYKAWSNNVQGNPLSSQVLCERIWPRTPGRMKFGVVYSEEAIPLTRTLDINVAAKPLTLLRATLDKYRLTLTFDQTLAKYTDCNEVFKDITTQEAKCWSVGNELRVDFKSTPKIGSRLTVKCASAADGHQDSFLAKVMKLQASEAISNLEIDGPDMVCSGQIATFNVDGAEAVNWTISIPINTSIRNSMTPGNQQRKNLMLWRGSREVGKALKNAIGSDNRATLNTSLLTAGNEYQMRAIMLDSGGQTWTLKKNFRVVKGEVGQPSIKGPSRLSSTHDALFEMENPVCDSKNANIKFAWSLDDNGRTLVQREGSKLKLENGLLSSNAKYNITLKMFNDTEVVSEVVKELNVEPTTSFKTAAYVEEIVCGTGQRIVLLSNPDLTPSKATEIKYKWNCESEHGACLRPGKEMQPVESLGGFDRSVLDLPAGSLPVGKYSFTLEAILPSGESTSKVIRVFIVPGEPTLLSLISIDFHQNLQIVLRAKHIIDECELNLESLKTNNSTFLELNDKENPVSVKGTLHSPLSRTLDFEVQREKLIFGSLYVFRLMADCKGLSQSWLKFSVPLPEMSSNCQLEVSPKSGEALVTEFTFRATDCWPTNPIYSFGFKVGEKTLFFTSTLEPEQKSFALPGLLVPVMKVCEPDKLCSMAAGAEIEVKSTEVDRTAINSVLELYEDNLKSGHFDEAVGCSEMLLMSSQDETLRKNLSESLVGLLFKMMNETKKTLANTDENVPNALELLRCAMSIVKITDASDEAISTVLEFRDAIEQVSSKIDGDVEDIGTNSKSKSKRSPMKQKRDASTESAVRRGLETGADGLSTVKGRSQERNETVKFLGKIPDYIRKMCPSLYGEEPFYFRKGSVEVTIVKLNIAPNLKKIEKRFPECLHDKCHNSSGTVVLTKSYLAGFSGNQSDICMGLNRYEEDLYSIVNNSTTEPNATRWSWIYASQLFNGSVITNDGINDPRREPLGTVTIPIWNATLPEDIDLKCHMWKNDVGWDDNYCAPEKNVTISKIFPAIECKCPFPGIYA
ncbi:Hypothetical protein NTJ_11082 [Nesidiocoris tenuis]|uniref:PKD/REJ-like domain-containing protein n=1 Tax=Nesidiocoris tenuis TaxID=355587 RepID=A0ABN7B3Q7_9HEMI|nr:Hypothetical protein NTJ_11082 [Nesidiocoris tenuis]